MKDLIARLKAATEGSRELDAEIFCKYGQDSVASRVTVGGRPLRGSPAEDGWVEAYDKHRGVGWKFEAPHYTTSLDAALTLVPEGAEFDMTTMYGVARVTVGLNFNPGPFYASNDCGLLPCAVSAAALKARESQP